MTLLEVLVSIFLLTGALLVLVAMLPITNAVMQKAARADRTQACGTAGLREVKARGLADPLRWSSGGLYEIVPTGSDYHVVPKSGNDVLNVEEQSAFVVDPLFLAQQMGQLLQANPAVADPAKDPSTKALVEAVSRFPYQPYDPAGFNPESPDLTWYNKSLTAERWGFDAVLIPPYNTNDQVAAQNARLAAIKRLAMWAFRVFTWHDDLDFGEAEGAEFRPRQMLLWRNKGNPNDVRFGWFPPRPADNPYVDPKQYNPLSSQSAGRFSWVAMVTPLVTPATDGYPNNVPVELISAYEVSIIVFENRNLYGPVDHALSPAPPDQPPERTAVADLSLGGGFVGEVSLTVTSAARGGYLDGLRPGNWLMLAGRDSLQRRVVFRWYQIVNVAEPETFVAGNQPCVRRQVSLDGPEWSPGWCFPIADLNGDGTPDPWQAQAALFTGVVGVYTTSVRVQ